VAIYLPLLFALIGGAFYILSTNPKVIEIARITFAAGLLAFLLHADSLVRVIK
jgi:hypothetical protein